MSFSLKAEYEKRTFVTWAISFGGVGSRTLNLLDFQQISKSRVGI